MYWGRYILFSRGLCVYHLVGESPLKACFSKDAATARGRRTGGFAGTTLQVLCVLNTFV
jgi:hypothetical protein